MQETVLYFGSFNPIHNGHIAIARHMAAQGNEVWLVVSPHNPLKESTTLAPDEDRLRMVELAVEHAAEPLIRACDIEFSLPKPSYTIDTLRALEGRYPDRRFSLLMGGDILPEFNKWKEYRTLLEKYTIWVYPRGGVESVRFGNRVKMLDGAPLLEFSSTQLRERLAAGEDCSSMADPWVLEYIHQKGLYAGHPTLNGQIEDVSQAIAVRPDDPELYIGRGKLYLSRNDFGPALNDFNRARELNPGDPESEQYADMVREILAFRHIDIYNP